MPGLPGLHVVTDDGVLRRRDFEETAREILRRGGRSVALHLRGPGSPGRRIYELGRALREIARETGALLVVNDRVDVALVAGLPAVQLPGRSLPAATARELLPEDAAVGVSVHGEGEARNAASDGADWVVVGTIWATPSHPAREPAGVGRLRRCADGIGIPVLAIGGVTPSRTAEALEAGAHGVAVLRGVWGADDPGSAVDAYLDALNAS